MADTQVDKVTFGRRLKQLYDHWKGPNAGMWAGSTALLVVTGSTSEDLRYLKSLALHLWLFGYELPDTVLAFTPTELHLVSSQKKVDVLQPVVETAAECGVKIVFHVKPKAEDGSTQMQEVISAIKLVEDTKQVIIGTLPKDQHTGKFYDMVMASITAEAAGLTQADVTGAFADVLSVKDSGEIMNHKKAAMLAARVLKDFVVGKIETTIDEGKTVKHSKLAEQTEDVITNPSKVGVKLKAENCDIAYPPLFQSGGKYDFKMSSVSDDSPLDDGVIVCSVGARYSFYCANISRTIFINPTKKQEAEYAALLTAQEAVIAALKDGINATAAADAAIKALKDAGQDGLIERLSRTLGHGMGLELRETGSSLPSRADGQARNIRAGQVYNVSLSFTGLENPEAKDAKSKVYAMQVADTVVVTDSGKSADVATSMCPKSWDKVSYVINDNSDGEDINLEDVTNGLELSKKKLRSEDAKHKSEEARRKQRQEDLVQRKNQETLQRLTMGRSGSEGGGVTAGGRKISEVVAYRGLSDYPSGSRDMLITVDPKAESILLPVYGIMVPFHITTIKNVTHAQDGSHAQIRVTFNFSGNYEPYIKYANQCVFLKELSFRSADVRHAARVVQEIKVLRSAVTLRDKEQAERATLVQQEKLVQGKRVYKLPDLWMRPALGGKGRKVPGTLEAHANGFRYVNPRHPNDPVHVMYRNIRHAFFQPADNEMITILHFHLINPIMLGNKKTKDVQFYAEVMDVVQTLDGGRRNMYDPDEIEEEQRERDRRNKINAEFDGFVKRVQELWEKDYGDLRLEFEVPIREFGFHGVPHRSTAFMLPTGNCLVELSEMPFTVVSLQDVEVVNLERVGFNLKNFDMAIVFKDFARDVLRIDAIPSKSLDIVKEWLDGVNIKYYESKLNLAWKPILKSIMDDPEGFVENGGWEFLNMEKSDSEGGEGEGSEQSEDYAPGEDSDDASDDESDDDSEDASVVDSDDEGEASDDDEDEDEEEGKTWDELEEEAKRDDKTRTYEEEEEERPAKRKGGSSGGAPAAKRRR